MATKISSAVKTERMALVVQGILAILFGLFAVFWPGMTDFTLIYLFSAFLIVDGIIIMILGLISMSNFSKALLLILLGLLELGIGLFLINNPLITFTTLVFVLGFSLVIRGIFSLVGAFVHKESSYSSRMLHGILGVLGVVVGLIVLFWPTESGLAFVWILGLYALVAGPILIAASFDLAKARK
jgi:uncharacterized membrane protein HdeD (DUF308 family)